MFGWGHGHYLMFAALGALGAGLEVAAEAVGGHAHARATVVSLSVAVPVVVFLLLLTPLHGALWDEPSTVPPSMLLTAVATLRLGCLPALGVPVALAVLLLSLPVAVLVAVVARPQR